MDDGFAALNPSYALCLCIDFATRGMALLSHVPCLVFMMDTDCMSSSESALVVLVPEAEVFAKPFRDQYDPSAAAGMPAHITLLYPFKAPDEVDDITLC